MHEGPPLVPAEDLEPPVHHGPHRQRIDDEVEPHPRREPEDGGEAEDDRRDAPAPLEDDVLGHDPRAGVEGDRVQRGRLGKEPLVAGTVDAARGGEDEAVDAVEVARLDEHLRALVVEVEGLFGVEATGGVADDGGEGDDGAGVPDAGGDVTDARDVALDEFEAGVPLKRTEAVFAEGESCPGRGRGGLARSASA